MNVRQSVARLPEPVRRLLENDPLIARLLQEGRELAGVLADPAWAAAWQADAGWLPQACLSWILRRYAALPFSEESAFDDAQADCRLTGAERKAGIAALRRSGVLFAVRKAWGERLYYLPADMVPVWLRLLLPVASVPLDPAADAEVRLSADPFRLPLSLALLPAWSHTFRHGLPFTSKGVPAKPAAARLASLLRMTAGELAPLALTATGNEAVTAPCALALELGIAAGVLERHGGGIAGDAAGLAAWLALGPASADAALYRLLTVRFAAASADPADHLAAALLGSARPSRWHALSDFARHGVTAPVLHAWLGLFAAFGWATRGTWRDQPVFRLETPLAGIESAEWQAPAGDLAADDETAAILIQPDCEIYVPPETGLRVRWQLEEIAERIAADRMFVYRLTRPACRRAYEAGWREEGVARFLREASGAELPDTVSEALADWYRDLGQVRVEEAVLLRVADVAIARRLAADPEAAACLRERIGDTAFVVASSRLKALTERLEQLGLPPEIPRVESARPAPARSGTAALPPDPAGMHGPGDIPRGSPLPRYEADPELPALETLFPGVKDVPPAWFRQTGAYHVSTRRELVRRAIAWKTALRVGGRQDWFVPQALTGRGDGWEVRGTWRQPEGPAMADSAGQAGLVETVMLAPTDLETVMIVLPSWESIP